MTGERLEARDSGSAQEITLATPVVHLTGVGPKRGSALLELGIKSVGQLIAHLPNRHELLHAEGTIKDLVPEANGAARGEVTATRIVRKGFGGARGGKGRFEAVLMDPSGRLDLIWFNGSYLQGTIVPGTRLRVQGKVSKYGPSLRMVNPKHELLGEKEESEPGLRDERMSPVYPASGQISSGEIDKLIRQSGVLQRLDELLIDHLSPTFREARQLFSLAQAYKSFHAPTTEDEVRAARRRLAYDELLLLQLGLMFKRSATANTFFATALRFNEQIDAQIRKKLPYVLTKAQDRVVGEIAKDLTSTSPMNRLVQGDVGSGKTLVAVYGCLLAAMGRTQSAIMAPTEILAEQHYRSISKMLENSAVRVALLTGSCETSERASVMAGLADGTIDIVVGTHALLSSGVVFKHLAVAVIDEQHRFGVHQRMVLRQKGLLGSGKVPHVLVMTATPIPRTVAMTVLGDLDVSVIDELPKGRKKVHTRVVDTMLSGEVYQWLATRLEAGEQAYVVAPAIDAGVEEEGSLFEVPTKEEGSEGAQAIAPAAASAPAPKPTSVLDVAQRLRTGELAGKRIEVLHGRLDQPDRERIMEKFRAGEIDVLVATTVIEVGVDVPNATVMVIEDAERFGLATLHQLRGRVGRGTKGGVCVLIARTATPLGGERLATMAKTSDGFELAKKDLELRGFGDVIGVRQSGMPPFRVADLSKDLDLLTMARRDAQAWLTESPKLEGPSNALVRTRMFKAHAKWLNLADVG